MEPAQPDPPEVNPVPVQTPPVPTATDLPVEARTLALRPGAGKRLAPEEKPTVPASEPAPVPRETANLANESTIAFNKVAQARAGVPAPTLVPPQPAPEMPRGATVSIHQVKRMRSQLEAPVPPASNDAPGTTTVPIRRGAGPQLVPEAAPPAVEPQVVPDPAPPAPEAELPALVVPTKPRPSAPGTSRPKPSAPGTVRPSTGSNPGVELDPKLLCPRCQTKLISPDSLGMCPSCGYCRSLEEGKRQVAPPESKTLSLFGLVEFCQLIGMMPLWGWALLGGMAAIVLATVYGTNHLPVVSAKRAWWGTGQFVLGLVLLAAAQGRALFQVAPHDERVGPLDLLLFSPRVWQRIFERLPLTRGVLWMACWGLTLTATALVLSGVPFTGLNNSEEGLLARELRYALGGMKPDEYRALQAAARGDVMAGAPTAPEREGDDTRPSKPCAVIGYTKDADGKPNGLIVAAPQNGRLQYAGIVRSGLRKSRELLERLGALEKVDGPAEGGAVWVKPELTVDVHHSGSGGKGNLNEPNLGGVRAAE